MTGATPERTDSAARVRIPDEVSAHVREKILSGRLRPGEHLHLERLAGDLGTSVTPVREALLALRGEGFVELIPRHGFTVSSLSRRDISDTFRIQATLAGELTARAAELIKEDQLVELALVQRRTHQTPSHTNVDELDARFHDVIYDVANSGKLAWFLAIAARYSPRRFSAAVAGWSEVIAEDHGKILLALRDRDPSTARRAAQAHVTRAGTMLIRHLEQQGFWSEQR